jgi:mycothiol system anti-sigma-R factor
MGTEHDKDVSDCREALHRIYHFLDGELTPARKDKIEAHLDSCSPCLHVFGFEAELRKLVADRCRDAVPESLRARIAGAIHHEHLSIADGADQGGEASASGAAPGGPPEPSATDEMAGGLTP